MTTTTLDLVQSYVDGTAPGGDGGGDGLTSVLLYVGFLALLTVAALVVARRVNRARRG